jgi:uracil-DNA glycosylase
MPNRENLEVKTPKIDQSWLTELKTEFESNYFKELKLFLLEEKKKQTIYPKGEDIFNAYNLTPFNLVKVVIIGQDPYHGENQAHGLCFSVKKGVKPPPSLKNIYKELKTDVGFNEPNHGELTQWAKQGVFLLNATLTVRKSQPGSHQKKGWETFTNETIKAISNKKKGVVFLLWGRFAQEKEKLIDAKKHHILKATHPSPFSAYNGFFGCKHFSKTNSLLQSQNLTPINWNLE